jgi:hypothetical protein
VIHNATPFLSANPVQHSLVSSPEPLSAPHETFVAEFMRNGGIASKAYAVAYPEVTSDLARRAHGSRLRARPEVAARIRDLRSIAAQALNAEVAELALQAHEVATASMVDIAPVEVYACRMCYSADGVHPAWIDAAELAAALDNHLKSLGGPMPLPMPSAGGGFAHDQFGPPSPSCRTCRGHGVAVLRIIPSHEWPEGAKQLYEGVQTDDEGRVTKVLIADRSKWAHQRNQLAGSYAPTRVEGKHAHLHIHKQAPDTRQPMSVEEAIAALEHSP